MNLFKILSSTKEIRPNASDEQIVRWILMMLVSEESITEESLASSVMQAEQTSRLMEDQVAAVTEELDMLASSQPSEFSPSHIWTLLKAIRVQQQMLELYDPTPVVEPVSSCL